MLKPLISASFKSKSTLRSSINMFSRAALGGAALAFIALGHTEAETFHLVKSLSDPAGKSMVAKFVLDETRSRFIYPQDKSDCLL